MSNGSPRSYESLETRSMLAATADIIFVVDESDSQSVGQSENGEAIRPWVSHITGELEDKLVGRGIGVVPEGLDPQDPDDLEVIERNQNRYGVLAYGDSNNGNPEPRALTLSGGDKFGSASDINEFLEQFSDTRVAKYRERMKAFRGTLGPDDPDRYRLRGEWSMNERRKLIEDICDSVLLQSQVSRLTELVLQQRLRDGGVVAVLRSHDISSGVAELKVPEHVVEEIESRTSHANEEYEDAIAELVKQFNKEKKLLEKKRSNEILKPLNDTQRQMFDKLFGEPLREPDAARALIDSVK